MLVVQPTPTLLMVLQAIQQRRGVCLFVSQLQWLLKRQWLRDTGAAHVSMALFRTSPGRLIALFRFRCEGDLPILAPLGALCTLVDMCSTE